MKRVAANVKNRLNTARSRRGLLAVALLAVVGAGILATLWINNRETETDERPEVVLGVESGASIARAYELAFDEKHDEAVTELEALLARTPHDLDKFHLLVALGDVRLQQRNFPRAYDAYRRANDIRELEASGTLLNQAVAARRIGNFEQSAKLYQAAAAAVKKESAKTNGSIDYITDAATKGLGVVRDRAKQMADHDETYVQLIGVIVAAERVADRVVAEDFLKQAQDYGQSKQISDATGEAIYEELKDFFIFDDQNQNAF